MSQNLSRRTILRGLGTAISLPVLEGMLPTSALAQTPKLRITRMAYLFVPNGMHMQHWTPSEIGASYTLPSTLQPLAPLQKQFSVLSGLAQHNAFALGDGPGDHARSTAAWLTGVHPKKTSGGDIRNGISADQVAALNIGKETKFSSLELGCERGAQAGDCDSGYSCAYSSSISWRSDTTPMGKEVNPRLVFERFFGSGPLGESEVARILRQKSRKSILDFVSSESADLRLKLGLRDQQKLDEYLQGIREIETRLERFERDHPETSLPGGGRPKGIPSDYGEHIRIMGDMMVLAFQADLTRVCTLMFANDGSNRSFRGIGISDGHHDVSHHGRDPVKLEKKRQIDRFQIEQLAYILNRMQAIKEVDGTLLDNTMLVYGAGISDGDRHNHDELPILLCGGGAGKLKPGFHHKFPKNTPMNNLFLSLLDRMGVPLDTLGDSTGKLRELF
jgi:hypothetical protein